MKIIYLVHTFYPESYAGTEKFIFNVASGIKSKLHQVKVITYSFLLNEQDLDCKKFKEKILYKEFSFGGLDILAFKFEDVSDNYRLNNNELKEFSEFVLEKELPDIIHAGHIMRVGEFINVAIEKKIPYVITTTDFFLMCPKFNLLNSNFEICKGSDSGRKCKDECRELEIDTVKRFKESINILHKSRYIIAPSKFLKSKFEENYNISNIKVINHGIDFSKVLKNEKSYSKDSNIVLAYCGTLNFYKGAHIIIEALNNIKNKNRVKLKIYGSGEDDILRIIVGKKGLSNIDFCGVYDENKIGKVMQENDLVIIPSLWNETYCLVLYEALACNVPVVVSNIGALPEKVKNHENGFVFEPGDDRQLAFIIDMIVENPEILNFIKDNLKSVNIQNIQSEVNEYEKLYINSLTTDSDEMKCNVSKTNSDYITKFNSIFNNDNFSIIENEWNDNINIISKNFGLDNKYLFSMKYRIDYLRERFINGKIKCLIWGSGNSGKITKILIDRFLPTFEISGFIDSYHTGFCEDIKIYDKESIEELEFDYVVISTTVGKNDAIRFLECKNLKLIDDYIYGYGL